MSVSIVFLQPGAQRAGAQRHHDVIDGDTGGVFDRLDFRKRDAGEGPAPMRADVLVERRCGRYQRRRRQDDIAVAAQNKPVDER
jgi:hypothetical protein